MPPVLEVVVPEPQGEAMVLAGAVVETVDSKMNKLPPRAEDSLPPVWYCGNQARYPELAPAVRCRVNLR